MSLPDDLRAIAVKLSRHSGGNTFVVRSAVAMARAAREIDRMAGLLRAQQTLLEQRTGVDRATLTRVLVFHQRTENGNCSCGWGTWGGSFAEHVATVFYEVADMEAST